MNEGPAAWNASVPTAKQPFVGDILVSSGSVGATAMERAQRVSTETGERLILVLPRLGLIGEDELAAILAQILGIQRVGLEGFPIVPVKEDYLSRGFLKRARCIPLVIDEISLSVAMADPTDDGTVEALSFAFGRQINRFVATASDIEAALQRLYPADQTPTANSHNQDDLAVEDAERMRDLASDAPVIRLVDTLIADAVESQASDIHFEPEENGLRLRFRIDGVLREMPPPPTGLRQAILSRLKLMAKLNIAERRLPQDGRISMAVKGKDIDFRVSTTPTIHGESLVLRILNRDALPLDLPALGFDGNLLTRFQQAQEQPHGIFLVTGPTGSGKTTTLYAALAALNSSEKKILTIEDPIEYHIAGINQVQVKPKIGLTFASALRSFLRQDPDIMMVGEIRDLETAQIAVQAALTGHLILSTLHTNDAVGTITRLLDMGVEDYLITSTVNGLMAQRLVRTLCSQCREPYEVLPEMVEKFRLDETLALSAQQFYRPVGCSNCNGSGYKGRTIIGEMLLMSDTLRQMVLHRAEARQIHQTAVNEGMRPMFRHGLAKAAAGITTIEEVLRATKAA